MTEPDETEQAEEKPAASEPRVYTTDDGWTITVTHKNRPSSAEIIERVIDVLEQRKAKGEKL